MSFESDLRQMAVDLLAELGTAATLTKTTGVTPNPATGTVSGGTSTLHAVTVSPPAPIQDDARGAFAVSTKMLEVWIAAQGAPATPADGDVLTFAARKYAIKQVWPYYAGAQIAAWRCFCEG